MASQPQPKSTLLTAALNDKGGDDDDNNHNDDNDDNQEIGLDHLQQDELLVWVLNHNVELQGKHTMKKGMFFLSLFPIDYNIHRYYHGNSGGTGEGAAFKGEHQGHHWHSKFFFFFSFFFFLLSFT